MMMFEAINQTTAVATNAIKTVQIIRDQNMWMLHTPEGRLLDEITSVGPFNSFEAAKREAEATVGMTMKWEDA